MLAELLIFGTTWFWSVIFVASLLLMFFVENERSWGAAFTIALTGVAFFLLGGKDWSQWVAHNPVPILQYLGAYVGIGVVWSIIKWFFYVLRARDEYEEYRNEWIADLRGKPFDPEAFKAHLSAKYSDPRSKFQPKVAAHKGRVIFWMAYWPWSGVWTIINDPIRRFYNFLYNRLGAIFDAISKKMFGKYDNELN